MVFPRLSGAFCVSVRLLAAFVGLLGLDLPRGYIFGGFGLRFCSLLAPFSLHFGSFLGSLGVPWSMSGFCRQIVGGLGRPGPPFGSVLASIWTSFFDEFCINFLIDFWEGFRLHFG